VTDRIHTAAHAKANLFLRVLAKEESGYHSLETLFTLLELHDDLTIERTGRGLEIDVEGADTGPTEKNLAYRAAKMVLEATGNRFGVRIHLTKTIPVQAGLGGGSADGAAALHAVNHLADTPIPRHEILQFAARLGSDVPFLASGAPMAVGWGHGERLYRVAPPASAAALIAVPPVKIDTAAAYRWIDAGRAESFHRGAVVLDTDAFSTWGGIGRLGGNDFESTVFGKHSRVRDLFEQLAETRPLLVRLSGSGSALIALYKTDVERDDAAMQIGETGKRLIKTSTRHQVAPGPT
jgi:4-diphosphocytidyl-2-C-methyl-D-erythritol kinase